MVNTKAKKPKTTSPNTVSPGNVEKYLSNMLDKEMSQGDRGAIVRVIQIIKGER